MNKSVTYYKNYFLQRILKKLLQKNTNLYINIQRFRYQGKRYSRKIVNINTDIVIEGYPRSANSFSVKAFKFSNGEEYKIATHLHAYPQIVEAVKLNIPTLVLIRDPFSCLASYAALRAQTYGVNNFNKNYNIKWLLEDYITFYKNLTPYRDKIVIAVFNEVLQDFGVIIMKLNKKFNCSFIPFEHTEQNVKTVFNTAKSHLSPSEKRDDIKIQYSKKIEALKKSDLFKEAEMIYKDWKSYKN
ncbi:MAG: hypothetical protein GY932_10125 [Arcobacter sp.]|nr:hypothetical protein [Arcobacter sp.]